MSKQGKSPRSGTAPRGKGNQYKQAGDCKFVDRNLMGVNPLKEQFEPSGSEPIRQHHKMAGGA